MDTNTNRSRLIFGACLVLLGLFLLFGEIVGSIFHIRIGHYTWPFTILVPGVLLYALAFTVDDNNSKGVVFAGSIVSGLGVLLFLQNLTGWWASWAYAWAFIFPTSIGVGEIVFGTLRNKKDMVSEGWRLTRIGLVILLFGVIFFELLIGISGIRFFGMRSLCFPAALVILGLALVLQYLLSGRRAQSAAVSPAPASQAVVIDAAPASPGQETSSEPEAAEEDQDQTSWEAGPEDKTT